MPLVAILLPMGEVQGELEGVDPGDTTVGGCHILSRNTKLLCRPSANLSELRLRSDKTSLNFGILLGLISYCAVVSK